MSAPRPANRLTTRPFRGTVTVRFMDVVLASTHDAVVARRDDGDDEIFIPFRDIYFDFLTRSDTREECPVKGEASVWSVRAMGRTEPDAMRSYGANEASAPLRDYGTFDPSKVTVERTPEDAPVA